MRQWWLCKAVRHCTPHKEASVHQLWAHQQPCASTIYMLKVEEHKQRHLTIGPGGPSDPLLPFSPMGPGGPGTPLRPCRHWTRSRKVLNYHSLSCCGVAWRQRTLVPGIPSVPFVPLSPFMPFSPLAPCNVTLQTIHTHVLGTIYTYTAQWAEIIYVTERKEDEVSARYAVGRIIACALKYFFKKCTLV